jgi:hypothetical protein
MVRRRHFLRSAVTREVVSTEKSPAGTRQCGCWHVGERVAVPHGRVSDIRRLGEVQDSNNRSVR